ncbi:MAG: 3',5'-cyclic-nucleotide phosphodiesterase pde1 [Claussenomyces sp. TS43310]|nr:MAG: 3',5'-cyclic-nucleotide phosphodiesterase pde1 [Claussenomyces sp. TS43310]
MVEGDEKPALQVIILGCGGGPKEDNTTAFLVRSTSSAWRRGSLLAVDAGVHLAAISKIIEPAIVEALATSKSMPITLSTGPFAGLQLPNKCPSANAAYVTRTLVETYLITHPHLDHISGFVVNTASLNGSRPKRLAGLPSTIEAFKLHIFNNVIWPNLSDENNGAGLVSYMRLVEGGSPYLGDDEGRGFVEVCDGLSVKTWSVSHGHCVERHEHRGSSAEFRPRGSHDLSHHIDSSPLGPMRAGSNAASQMYHRQGISPERYQQERICVYDSSAYFIRDINTGREVLIFGDVEPDCISLSPRNLRVWSEAAPKIASGLLRGIFIECSYDDSQADKVLFGHLAPRHLVAELKVLARCVEEVRESEQNDDKGDDRIDGSGKKRKRFSNGIELETPGSGLRRSGRTSSGMHTSSLVEGRPNAARADSSGLSPRTRPQLLSGMEVAQFDEEPLVDHPATSTRSMLASGEPDEERFFGTTTPLQGLKVIVIHVKDKLVDGKTVGESILEELLEYEEDLGLGCEFVISEIGMSVFL